MFIPTKQDEKYKLQITMLTAESAERLKKYLEQLKNKEH